MALFSELQLNERLLKAVDKLGFNEATEVQAQVLPLAGEGKDLVVSAQTGSGKTAAFILPMLERFLAQSKPNSGTRGLILVPTRELALQIQKTFAELAAFTQIKAGLIIGGELFKHQVASIRRNPEVFIATPGRLVEHIEKNSIDFADLECLVLDEADRMLDMGFAEELHTISQSCNTARQNLLFSATFNHRGFSRVRAQLKGPVHLELNPADKLNKNIRQQRILCDDVKHKQAVVRALLAERDNDKAFVFCNTREQAQRLGELLQSAGIKTGFIHGEIRQSDRKQVLNRFRDGKIRVLVATDVAARGLDIDALDLVVNFNVAQSGDDHVHRIGRTGRADSQGLAITLVMDNEWNRMAGIERYLNFRFEDSAVDGLKARYKGPKKIKKSGSAAGSKKKKQAKKNNTAKNPARKAAKKPASAQPKRKSLGLGDGSAPLKRRS
ncbi:DEAD/DEAH box helicase [Agaribacterium haliotis]|uniref:DEAD/DEAH box helicase n=1 Tax=Agaribacterium haliotis TaxID=2013869 RepID=UPI001959E2A0|nr:DEAD/DEAH box helicase [Agaribacterium haliotis]